MKQSVMRKWHRRMGIVIALFVFFQVGSGLLITVSDFSTSTAQANGQHGHDQASGEESEWNEALEWIHHGHSEWMSVYRLLLGAGILVQTVVGLMIFFDIRRRRAASQIH